MSDNKPSTSTPKQIVVLGGNGYVGSHILQELVRRKHRDINPSNLKLKGVSRRGTPPNGSDSWNKEVEWEAVDVSKQNPLLANAIKGSTAVISCIGGFGSVAVMEKVNGDTNINAIETAKEQGVPRFVYISAHHFQLPQTLQKGYYAGKFATERALFENYGEQGVQIRPGFIHGSRRVGGMNVPLWLVGIPLQKITTIGFVRKIQNIPFLGPVFAPILTPPVSVEAVAKAAADAALAEKATKTILEVDDLLHFEKK